MPEFPITVPHSFARGFTLIEAVISMVIVGVMAVAAIRTVGAAARSQRMQSNWGRGMGLASQIMSEILQQRYEEPVDTVQFGRESGESSSSRANWDDVDDYEGLSDSPPKDSNGNVIAGFTNWRVAIKVKFVQPATLAETGAETGLKKITVTITDAKSTDTVLVALRSRNSTFDRTPSSQTTYICWVGIDLQTNSSEHIFGGASPLNLVP